MNWKVEPKSDNVHDLVFTDDYRNAEWEQWVLLTGDRHWDNPKSDWKLQKKHLDQARERNAPVIDVGDFFCLMQGKYDKRGTKKDIRPEHLTNDYFDSVPNTAVEFFKNYADLFAVIGTGNHEASIKRHHETDVLGRFIYRLNAEAGSNVQLGGYGGYVRIRFQEPDGRSKKSKLLKYYHGSGGGGAVTKGLIQTNRRAVFMPDADIIVTGHIHEKWAVTLTRERVSPQGKVYIEDQHHICVGPYKEEYNSGKSGWHVERGAPPKPLGGYWLRFTWDRETESISIQTLSTI